MEAPKNKLEAYVNTVDSSCTVKENAEIGFFTGLILRNEDRFLTLHFTDGRDNPWRFAGGKVEPNELPITAAIRELKEELGVDAVSLRFIDTVNRHIPHIRPKIWVGYYYLVDYVGLPTIMEPDKHDDLRYMSFEELEMLAPQEAKMVESCRDYLQPIQAKLDDLKAADLDGSTNLITAKLAALYEEIRRYAKAQNLKMRDLHSMAKYFRRINET